MFRGIWGWIHALKDDREALYIYMCVCVCVVYNKVLCKGMMMQM
jgi:hypothetical protein